MKQNRLKHPGNAFTRGNPAGLPIAYKNNRNMKTRVILNWKTTLIGCILLASVVVLAVTKTISIETGIGYTILSLLLLWIKDSVFKV